SSRSDISFSTRQGSRGGRPPASSRRTSRQSASPTVAFLFRHRDPVAGLALRAGDTIALAPLGLLDHHTRAARLLDDHVRPPRILDFHAGRTDSHIDVDLRRRDPIYQGNGGRRDNCRGERHHELFSWRPLWLYWPRNNDGGFGTFRLWNAMSVSGFGNRWR